MNVLIIEPDHILTKVYKKAFEQAGLQVDCCGSAQEAFIKIDKNMPDAVVLELQLAGHSGIEFLHEFRSYDDWQKVPVFIYSSVPEYAFAVDPKSWAAFGVKRYFYKPKSPINLLIGAVKQAISNGSDT